MANTIPQIADLHLQHCAAGGGTGVTELEASVSWHAQTVGLAQGIASYTSSHDDGPHPP